MKVRSGVVVFSFGLMGMSLTRCLQLCAFAQSFTIKTRCNGKFCGVMVKVVVMLA